MSLIRDNNNPDLWKWSQRWHTCMTGYYRRAVSSPRSEFARRPPNDQCVTPLAGATLSVLLVSPLTLTTSEIFCLHRDHLCGARPIFGCGLKCRWLWSTKVNWPWFCEKAGTKEACCFVWGVHWLWFCKERKKERIAGRQQFDVLARMQQSVTCIMLF